MPELTFGPAYVIETDRLRLRCWSPEDAPALRKLIDRSADSLRPSIPWMRDEPATLHATANRLREFRARFDRDEEYRHAIVLRDSGELVGDVGLFKRAGKGAREIGYLVDINHTGRGYAREASAAMVRWAFEFDRSEVVDRIEIICAPDNVGSAAIPRKLGFTHEATLRRRFETPDGRRQDSQVWTLFGNEYPGSPASQVNMRALDVLGEPLAARGL